MHKSSQKPSTKYLDDINPNFRLEIKSRLLRRVNKIELSVLSKMIYY